MSRPTLNAFATGVDTEPVAPMTRRILKVFFAPTDGAPDGIDDPPSRSSAPEEIAKLPPTRMPLIAENYGTFVFEAAFRRPPSGS